MQKIWKIQPENFSRRDVLMKETGVSSVIAQLLINRGVEDEIGFQQFFESTLKRLHDPFLLTGMDIAIKRIHLAKQNGEKVLVYGDYDVDGVTSSAILTKAFQRIGLEVVNYIPHRVDEGYGLNREIVEYAKAQKVSLLITIDCGITAFEEVNLLNKSHVDVIVVDHHEPAEGLPDAVAVINAKRKDCPYPFKHLAAAGLAAKLAQALIGELPRDMLHLAALGTIADVVPLVGENRIFVKEGLSDIQNTTNKGLIALLDVSKILGKNIKPFHVGFVLGPRLNAAGRMDSAQTALDLFLSEDFNEAYRYAHVLEKHNQDRQKMQKGVVQEALDIIEKEVSFKDHKVIVLSKEGWHRGVLGIAASKITEKYYRPAIVISTDNGVGTASARSVEGFHLHQALTQCADCLEEFGGHQGAAGLTIKEENIEMFREAINSLAHETLEAKKLIPTINVEGEISLSDINLDLAYEIEKMQPFGEGNPAPVFCTKNLEIKSKVMVLGKDTIKFWVTDGLNTISAVGFGMGKYSQFISQNDRVDLAYEISVDSWNKAPTPQLILKDIKF